MKQKINEIFVQIRKWHAFNQILLYIIFALLSVIFYEFTCYYNNYKWAVSYSSPLHYNAIILENSYVFKRGHVEINSGKTKNERSWKEPYTFYPETHLKYSAPDSLKVNWLSISEGKFYKGSFKLPKNRIKEALKKGYNPKIFTGFTPHGNTFVFMYNRQKTKKTMKIAEYKAIEDTAMTPQKYFLELTNRKNAQEFEKAYARPLYTNHEIMMDYMTKEDSVYIAKHGIPDTW